MVEIYRRVRGYAWNVDYITCEHARRLISEADKAGESDSAARPEYVDGVISFVAGRLCGVGGMRVWLRPVARELVPPDVIERLEAEAAGNAPGAAGAC